ncbi:MAG TPA: CAP domain-containing protein, partial [Actinomycetota bacterium]|nr:CAP domain-containing protein [Actinomycetota bacterium]
MSVQRRHLLFLTVISAAVILVTSIPAIAQECPPNDASCAPSIASLESQLLDLVNGERTGAGLSALSVNSWAASIAHAWSEKMRADADISHDDSYFAQARSNMPGARLLGENVAMGGSVQRIHDLFMQSPSHRENVMEPRFTHVGIG